MSSGLTLKQIRSLAYKMLAIRTRTSQQVVIYLQKKGAVPALIEQVVAELQEAGYLNDRVFSENYIAVRLEQKPRGQLYFQAKLCAAGIERSLVSQVLCDLYPPEREREEALHFVRIIKGDGVACPHQTLRKLQARGFTGNAARYAVQQEILT
ncbi:MAG: RecX family transcriptional regulator [Dethiobacter sp.]|jgi:regulatory protein|nr:RecX family transcriptional regulator [Dethiobacter sp.]MBS3898274.1 RecX family transcriptional regulator [Dethiobacter sp.]MBS3982937.1 RecX family transcriptional regulator [Dethiobacter sp.]MCL4462393.1 RecX family transcriptional regulator [Bacillota bacterium]MCL5994364.1 RecX family transcriptional regulator [Bacillota bacterium]